MEATKERMKRLSSEDLEALAYGDIGQVSTDGLRSLAEGYKVAGRNPFDAFDEAPEGVKFTRVEGDPFDPFDYPDEEAPTNTAEAFDPFDSPQSKVTKVRAPDGNIVKVKHPYNASDQEIISYAKKNYSTGSKQGNENKLFMTEFDPTLKQPINELPKGFKLDDPGKLPEGFKLDEAGSAIVQTAKDTGELALNMAKNFPGDLVELANDTGKAFLHPVDTANALGNFIIEMGKEAGEALLDPVETAKSIKDFIVNPENRHKLNTFMAEHPAKTMAAFPLAGGGVGGAVSVAGKLSKAPQVVNAGKTIAQASAKVDPLSMATSGATTATKKLGDFAAESLGTATGAGKEAIKQAANSTGLTSNSNSFVRAMRGNTTMDDTVNNAQNALRSFKRKRLDKIHTDLEEMGSNKTYIDMRPIKTKMQDMMKRYNIKIDAQGNLDFSRSALDRNSRADIEAIIKDVSEWGSRQGDNTPTGLHILKQRLDDFYSDNKNSRALVTSLRNTVKGQIVKHVPEYAKMMKEYEKASGAITQIEKALSLSDRAMMDTAIKKLISTNRENFEFRKALLSELEANSGVSLSGEIAGHAMNQVIPKGLVGKLAAAGVGGAAFSNPWLLAILPMTSPRLVGEFLNSLGYPTKKISTFIGIAKKSGLFDPRVRTSAAMTQDLDTKSK